jgi:serine protease
VAVEKCVENTDAQIINLSLGGPFMGVLSDRLYTELGEKGIMLVAAAGNDGIEDMTYPASHPNVILVGAIYKWGTWCAYPNNNIQVELVVAPGGHQILSATISNSAVHILMTLDTQLSTSRGHVMTSL